MTSRAEIAIEAERVPRDRSTACDWLAERNPALDGKSPWEVSGDDPERVLALLRRLSASDGRWKILPRR